MKKTLMVTILTIVAVVLLTNTYSVYAWEDCPKGMINDEAPGACSKFIDTDGNGICDHSEPAPEDRVEAEKDTQDAIINQENNTTTTGSEAAGRTQSQTAKDNNTIAILSILIPLVAIIIYVLINKKGVKKNLHED